MCFNYKGERRLALGTTWSATPVNFVRYFVKCFIPFAVGFFAYDTCMFMVQVEKFSAVLARLCKFYGVWAIVANIRRECHIHCLTRGVQSCHGQWYILERIVFGRALHAREAGFQPRFRLKKSLHHNVRPVPPARVPRRYLPQPSSSSV